MNIRAWAKQNITREDYAVVTGTTSGIGKEYALALAAVGCNLVCVSNEADALETQKVDLESRFDIKVRNVVVDLRSTESTKRAAKELENLSIKILINNAGFGLKGPFQAHPVDAYLDIISVNAMAPVIFTHQVLPGMQKRGVGLVIHVASINAIVPIPNNQVYTATKAFCYSYASAIARENKKTNILFQLVLPGTTLTPFHDRQGAHPGRTAMLPNIVVERSLKNVGAAVCIPNNGDRVLAKIFPFLPRVFAMDLASYMLKRRLGV